jgi:hypothetical protein
MRDGAVMKVIVLHNLDDLLATGLPYSTQDKPFTTFWNECGQPARINYVLDKKRDWNLLVDSVNREVNETIEREHKWGRDIFLWALNEENKYKEIFLHAIKWIESNLYDGKNQNGYR